MANTKAKTGISLETRICTGNVPRTRLEKVILLNWPFVLIQNSLRFEFDYGMANRF